MFLQNLFFLLNQSISCTVTPKNDIYLISKDKIVTFYFDGNVLYSQITDKRPTCQLQSSYQHTRQTLGFQQNIVSKNSLLLQLSISFCFVIFCRTCGTAIICVGDTISRVCAFCLWQRNPSGSTQVSQFLLSQDIQLPWSKQCKCCIDLHKPSKIVYFYFVV